MTLNLFITLLVIFAAISGLFTEAVKKFFENAGKQVSANLVAIINSVVIGIGGTIAAYIIYAIPFTATNIVAMIAMIFFVAIGSMIGYDKVIQLIKQLSK